jgi:hypothetical protein
MGITVGIIRSYCLQKNCLTWIISVQLYISGKCRGMRIRICEYLNVTKVVHASAHECLEASEYRYLPVTKGDGMEMITRT